MAFAVQKAFRSSLLLRPALKPLTLRTHIAMGARSYISKSESWRFAPIFRSDIFTGVLPAFQRSPLYNCYGSLVVPSSSPWRCFLSQAQCNHKKIQGSSSAEIFFLAVSIFSVCSPGELGTIPSRCAFSHSDAKLLARILDNVLQELKKRGPSTDLWHKLHAVAQILVT